MMDFDYIRYRNMTSSCIHCGACRENCSFLTEYGCELSDVEELAPLAYHCFICGKCDEVCPVDIKGTELFLEMRREHVARENGIYDPGRYSGMLKEKSDYIFRNYKKAAGKTVIFPGCNFPSLFPKTNKAFAGMMKKKYGYGIAYDCCGKPIGLLGLEKEEERIIGTIRKNLQEAGAEEIVTMCPNCYYYLKDRLGIRVVSVYRRLLELGIEVEKPQGLKIFMPCPDRETGEWYDDISELLGYRSEKEDEVNCCGLGGIAGACEPELSKEYAQIIGKKYPVGGEKTLCTCCASCAGQFARNGGDLRHTLSLMLGIDEKPAVKTSYVNRMMTKYK